MLCNECMYGIYLQALSEGECEICKTPVYTSHMPCDLLCVDCSQEHQRCKSCGKPMTNE